MSEEEEMTEEQRREMVEVTMELLRTKDGIQSVSNLLVESTRKGKMEWLKVLLHVRADVDAVSDETDTTALQMAVGMEEDSSAIVELLLESRANPNTPAGDGCTAMISAAEQGCPKHMARLIKARADVNAQAKDGRSALFSAVEYAGTGCPKDVVDDTSGASYEPLKLLVAGSADLGIKDKAGNSALDLAQSLKKTGAVEILEAVGGEDWLTRWCITNSL